MKRVLITGSNSYIGTWLEKRLSRESNYYKVSTIDVRKDDWSDRDFSEYDTVCHVAAMVHHKERKDMEAMYLNVNRDLALEVAKKAKNEGVGHFIFFSTMNVYGLLTGMIDASTPMRPLTAYGKSKAAAEILLKELEDDHFALAILRPPMVYGDDCRGNYQRIRKLALSSLPFFPKIQNQRSMIYIENLIEYIKCLIDQEEGGLHFPQNPEYVSTIQMVSLIARANGKKLRFTKVFNPIVKMLNIDTFAKLFGDLTYDYSLTPPNRLFDVCSFEESILRTERGSKTYKSLKEGRKVQCL